MKFTQGEILVKAMQLQHPMNITPRNVSYAKSKNAKIFERLAKELTFKFVYPVTAEEYQKYEQEVKKLYETASKGKTTMVQGPQGPEEIYDVDPMDKKFQKDKASLDDKYKDVLEDYKIKMEEYQKFKQEPFDTDVEVYMIDFDALPDEFPDSYMSILEFMIREVSITDFNKLKE